MKLADPTPGPETTFTEYVEGMGGQDDFAKLVGYSRKQINSFCTGKTPTALPLIRIWQMAIRTEKQRTEICNLKRENVKIKRELAQCQKQTTTL